MAATNEFTTIATRDILDFLCDAVDMARRSTAPAPWQNAISAAWDELLQLDTISYDTSAHALRVESATRAGRVYIANGDCQCEAFTRGAGVCWHRAAARLVRRALELRDIAGEIIDCRAAEGEQISPSSAAYVARLEHAEIAAVAVRWDGESERQRRAVAARIGAAQAAQIQAQVDELFPPRVAV